MYTNMLGFERENQFTITITTLKILNMGQVPAPESWKKNQLSRIFAIVLHASVGVFISRIHVEDHYYAI